MPNYITITEGETDPGAPGTSSLWKRWRDNPLAIAEGASGAPKVSPLAFSGTRMLPMASIITSLGAVRVLEFMLRFDMSGGSNTFEARFSTNNGSSWGSYQVLYSSAAETWQRLGRLNLRTGAFLVGSTTGTLTVPADLDAVQFRVVGTGPGFELSPMIGGGNT